ncbi:MAG: hypothetical protein QXK88_07770 [Desulfurococcaceae archaeon]
MDKKMGDLKLPVPTSLKRVMLLLILQSSFIFLSPYIQSFFQHIIDFTNLDHLLLIFVVVIPYLSALFTVCILGPGSEESLYTSKIKIVSKVDIPLVACLIFISLIIFSKFSQYDMPVGYDTPLYLAWVEAMLKEMKFKFSITDFLIGRQFYIYLLTILKSFLNVDSLILGRFLWCQIILLLIPLYLLVKLLTNSSFIGFVSGLLMIFWHRTPRLISDLHANVFGIFVMLILFIIIFLITNTHTSYVMKLSTISFFGTLFIYQFHQMTALVFALAMMGYLVSQSISYVMVIHMKGVANNIVKNRSTKIVLFLLPITMYILCRGFVTAGSSIVNFYPLMKDFLRKWWPEIPIYNFESFVGSLGGWYIFILAEIGIVYIIVKHRTKCFIRILMVYLITSLLLFQNNIFGLHALPERFAVFTLMPIYASLGLNYIREIFGQHLTRNVRLRIDFFSKSFSRRTSNIHNISFVMILLILLSQIVPLQLAIIDRYGPTISREAYEDLKYLRDYYVNIDIRSNKSVLIIFSNTKLLEWMKQLMPIKAIRYPQDPVVGMAGLTTYSYNIEKIKLWEVVYLIDPSKNYFQNIGYSYYEIILNSSIIIYKITQNQS